MSRRARIAVTFEGRHLGDYRFSIRRTLVPHARLSHVTNEGVVLPIKGIGIEDIGDGVSTPMAYPRLAYVVSLGERTFELFPPNDAEEERVCEFALRLRSSNDGYATAEAFYDDYPLGSSFCVMGPEPPKPVKVDRADAIRAVGRIPGSCPFVLEVLDALKGGVKSIEITDEITTD